MITKDPCGSMATKQTLRMLGVSAAEMPHIRHISFKRRLSDCRFLRLSRILQSVISEDKRDEKICKTNYNTHTHKKTSAKKSIKTRNHYPLTPRVLSCQVCQSPLSRGLMSSAQVPNTSPKVSVDPVVGPNPFSSVLCESRVGQNSS